MTKPTNAEDDASLLEEAGLWCFRVADGNMSDDEQAEFERWLARSDRHRSAFDDTIGTWRGIDEISIQPDILALRSSALEELRTTNRRRWSANGVSRRPLLAIAASITLLLLSYSAYAHYAFTAYLTGTGERRVVLLEDGSRLSLDADTKVLVRFNRNRRELQLTYGRAKFDVAKDALRPFTVEAGDRVVVATGTEFSVELLSLKVHVILYEGHVNVLAAQDAAREGLKAKALTNEVQLATGRELVATASNQAQSQPTDLAGTLSWEAGFLTFTDEPLQSAIERINRYTNTKLAVGDSASAHALVNGIYPAGNSDAFVEGVTGVLPVRVEDRNGVRTFLQRSNLKSY